MLDDINFFIKNKDSLEFQHYVYLIQDDTHRKTRDIKKITKWLLVISSLNLIVMLLVMLLLIL